MVRAFCISSNNAGNPSAKTWQKQGTAAQVSGSSAKCSQAICGQLSQPVLTRATPGSCHLAVGYNRPCCQSEMSWEFQGEEFQTSSRGASIPFLCQTPVLLEGSFSFLPLRLLAYWDVPHVTDSAPSSTLVDDDGIGCTWPLWVLTPGTLSLWLWFC